MQQHSSEIADRLVYFFGLSETIPERKRRLFTGMLLLGIILLFGDLALTPFLGVDWFYTIADGVMILFLGITAWLLWRSRERQEFILFGVFFGSALYLLVTMYYNCQQHSPLIGEQGLLRNISPWLVWIILLELICFLTFRPATALRMALVIMILFMIILVLAIFAMNPLPPSALRDLVILLAANALVILLAFPLAQSQEQNAQTDFLTGLPNRSHGYTALLAEIERARRYDENFAIILFDIDHFKKINDTCGHPCGDTVLREVAAFINGHIRRTDVFTRWGGEEFLIMMSRTDLASARLKADHLRQQLKNRPFHQDIFLTASFGVTAYYPFDTTNSLLERVDDALYRAKRNGRNCVEVE